MGDTGGGYEYGTQVMVRREYFDGKRCSMGFCHLE